MIAYDDDSCDNFVSVNKQNRKALQWQRWPLVCLNDPHHDDNVWQPSAGKLLAIYRARERSRSGLRICNSHLSCKYTEEEVGRSVWYRWRGPLSSREIIYLQRGQDRAGLAVLDLPSSYSTVATMSNTGGDKSEGWCYGAVFTLGVRHEMVNGHRKAGGAKRS